MIIVVDEAEGLPSVQGNKKFSLPRSRLFTTSILPIKHDSEKFYLSSATETKECAVAGGKAVDACMDHKCEQNNGSKKRIERSESSTNCLRNSYRNEQSVSQAKHATSQLLECVDANSSARIKAVCQSGTHLDTSPTFKVSEKCDSTDSERKKGSISASKNSRANSKSSSCRSRDPLLDQQALDDRVHAAQCRSSLVNSAHVNNSDERQWSWLDEGLELALQGESGEASSEFLVSPFGFWWCLVPEVDIDEILAEEAVAAQSLSSRRFSSGARLSEFSPLLGESVAQMRLSTMDLASI